MWVKEVSRAAYPTKEDLGEDVVRILREEVFALRDAGVDFIQFDEPVLTELVFTQGQTRTFMCAALAARHDPAEELEFATSLLNRVVDGLEGVRVGLHICRGNWSQNEQVLLKGSYHPLVPYLERMKVQQFVLEFATPRAGDLEAIAEAAREQGAGTGGGQSPHRRGRVAGTDCGEGTRGPPLSAGGASLPQPRLRIWNLRTAAAQHAGNRHKEARSNSQAAGILRATA